MINPLRAVGLWLFSQDLERTGPSLTFRRLCTSRHVDDLQAIACGAIAVLLLAVIYFRYIVVDFTDLHEGLVVVAGLFAAGSAALGWAYQAGSKRLGAVDLFASEISVICKVCLTTDFAKSSVQRAEQYASPAVNDNVVPLSFGKFTSEERYTPVYDGSIAELQPLDFDVVTEVTRFYTYRKTMMDLLRRLSQTSTPAERATLTNQMIYMQYLMYESGRLAIKKLVEFEPYQSECMAIILCSEFVLYAYLRKSYSDTFQDRKLRLRLKNYKTEFKALKRKIDNGGDAPYWLNAKATAHETNERYETMFASVRLLEDPSKVAA